MLGYLRHPWRLFGRLRQVKKKLPKVASLEQVLFDKAEQMWNNSSPILDYYEPGLIGLSGNLDCISNYTSWLREFGFDFAPECFESRVEKFSAYFFVLSPDQCLPEIYEKLLTFRASYPSVPVLVFGHSISNDDLQADRLNLYDRAVKLPMTSHRLELAMWDAAEVNFSWQDRIEKLRRLHPKISSDLPDSVIFSYEYHGGKHRTKMNNE